MLTMLKNQKSNPITPYPCPIHAMQVSYPLTNPQPVPSNAIPPPKRKPKVHPSKEPCQSSSPR
ncbi:hypothetical protein B0T16DRAFT_181864 [Cercophora newfieldiana]|uniref:Uncharacterized protein n=1 Tax=Cercophora newfieldiana TaxID=92897 RepID=A0AA39XZZ2_9PEZI|nr:hypothetical protein B0T16DRAFT_181864 [Cercophora newfieldiana]